MRELVSDEIYKKVTEAENLIIATIKDLVNTIEVLQFEGGREKDMVKTAMEIVQTLNVLKGREEEILRRAGFEKIFYDDLKKIHYLLTEASMTKYDLDSAMGTIGYQIKNKKYLREDKNTKGEDI